jgi:hypothetical protein
MTRRDSAADIEKVLNRARHPLTTAEVNTRMNRSDGSLAHTRAQLSDAEWPSRQLTVSIGKGRAPTVWAATKEALAAAHPAERAAGIDPPAPRRRRRTTRKAVDAAKPTAVPVVLSGMLRMTDLRLGDGAKVASDEVGHLYVVRPLVEERQS